jgi:hypothetical protein
MRYGMHPSISAIHELSKIRVPVVREKTYRRVDEAYWRLPQRNSCIINQCDHGTDDRRASRCPRDGVPFASYEYSVIFAVG